MSFQRGRRHDRPAISFQLFSFWPHRSICVTHAMKLRFTRRRRGLPIREAERLLAGDNAGASSPGSGSAGRPIGEGGPVTDREVENALFRACRVGRCALGLAVPAHLWRRIPRARSGFAIGRVCLPPRSLLTCAACLQVCLGRCVMVACVGPLATQHRGPGQARKGAAAAVAACAGVWLA